jgi:hypothetical protein
VKYISKVCVHLQFSLVVTEPIAIIMIRDIVILDIRQPLYHYCQNSFDGFGCTGQSCTHECRYYSETGKIEDSEVIQKHRELEERFRKNNAIIEPPLRRI